MNNLNWFVAFKIPADTQDDKKEKEQIIAGFRYPYEAEDFIQKCLPTETQDKFYIVHK